MKSALKPALENLDKALSRLEASIDRKLQMLSTEAEEPELDLDARSERDVNRKIAARLDQTINRLEVLLSDSQH